MALSDISVSSRQIAACEALIYNVLQRGEPRQGSRGVALGLVSAHPGAGVSLISHLLEERLNENAPGSAVQIDCCSLGITNVRQQVAAAIPTPDRAEIGTRKAIGRYRNRAEHLNSLKNVYPYVLVDSRSLKERPDILGLAPLLDGILIVVEGDKTTRSQLNYLERSIEEYGGSILGCVLNKRTYPIPELIFRGMERLGI